MGDATTSNELLERVKEAGCVMFKVGVESIDQEVATKIPKPVTRESIQRISDKCKELDEVSHGYNIQKKESSLCRSI